ASPVRVTVRLIQSAVHLGQLSIGLVRFSATSTRPCCCCAATSVAFARAASTSVAVQIADLLPLTSRSRPSLPPWISRPPRPLPPVSPAKCTLDQKIASSSRIPFSQRALPSYKWGSHLSCGVTRPLN
ncbi:unnamed protein product, partial [Laminaria digitata]